MDQWRWLLDGLNYIDQRDNHGEPDLQKFPFEWISIVLCQEFPRFVVVISKRGTPEIGNITQKLCSYVAVGFWVSVLVTSVGKIKLKKVMRLSKVLMDSTKSELLTEYPQWKPLLSEILNNCDTWFMISAWRETKVSIQQSHSMPFGHHRSARRHWLKGESGQNVTDLTTSICLTFMACCVVKPWWNFLLFKLYHKHHCMSGLGHRTYMGHRVDSYVEVFRLACQLQRVHDIKPVQEPSLMWH